MHIIAQRFLLSLALAVAIPISSAAAASFPEKPIEFTVPFAAGGGSDIMARTIAAMMEKEKILPQPLVVVNRPGASGVLGYMHVGQKTGDPYAITTATNSFVIQPLLGKMKLGLPGVLADRRSRAGRVCFDRPRELALPHGARPDRSREASAEEREGRRVERAEHRLHHHSPRGESDRSSIQLYCF